jgi:hypothetical protein
MKIKLFKIDKHCPILIVIIVIIVFSLMPAGIKPLLAFGECKDPVSLINETQVDWPASPLGGYTLDENSRLADLVGYFFGWGVSLGGLAVFIALIIAGIQYITSVADPKKLNEAKDRIKSAAIGLALLLSSWAIFNLINPNLTSMETNLYSPKELKIERAPCSSASDCCDTKSPQCIQKNWRCCRNNDTKCIETGVETKSAPGSFEIGAECLGDHACKSLYCGCNYGINPKNSTKDNWKNVCLPNPKICIEYPAAPELGCDKIIFYGETQLKGGETFSVEGEINGGWVWFPAGFQPRSYQAFYKEKDNQGKETGELKPCGVMACGCQINRCLDGGQGAGKSHCINDTADKETGEFMEYAYSEANFEEISGVRIKDKTKSAGIKEEDNLPWWMKLFQ